MRSHHFENEGPEPTEENLLQTVRCIYCDVVDTRRFAPLDPNNPTAMVSRIYAVRTIPTSAVCPQPAREGRT